MVQTSRPISGMVTFLFTDVEGSTRLWEDHPGAMQLALARHDALLRQAIEAHGGRLFKTVHGQLLYLESVNCFTHASGEGGRLHALK